MIDDKDITVDHFFELKRISMLDFLEMARDGIIPCKDRSALYSLIDEIHRGRLIFREKTRMDLLWAFGGEFRLLRHISIEGFMNRSNHCGIQPSLCEVWIARTGVVSSNYYHPRIARIPFSKEVLDAILVYKKLNDATY